MGLTASKIRAQVTADTDEAERKMRGFGQTVSGTAQQGSQSLGGLKSAFASLGPALGVASIGAAAVGLGKLALSAEKVREEDAQLEARFVGLTGGIDKASAAMAAMDAALGNSLTQDEKVMAATQMMGLGIAKNAEDAATMTQQAMILGVGIEQLTQALETGRANGLVQYGFSLSEITKRAAEAQTANANLTDVEAKAIAIKEQLADKASKVADAGGQAATATKQLENAWDDLKQAGAQKINLEVAINGATDTLNLLTAILNGPAADAGRAVEESNRESAVQNARRDLQEAMQARADYYQQLERIRAQAEKDNRVLPEGFDSDLAIFDERIAKAQATLNELNIELALTRARADESGSSMLQIGPAVAKAMAEAKAGVKGVSDELGDSKDYWDAWGTFAENAAMRASRAAWAARSAMGRVTEPVEVEPSKTRWGMYGEWAQNRVDSGAGDLVKEWQDRMTAANRAIATQAGRGMTDSLRSAADDFQTRFKNALQAGQSFSIGLKDFRPGGDKGPNAPGMNGAFEDIYRLQAWLNDGTWGETAKKYGGDRADITQRVQKFQSGMWDESVKQMINIPQLTEQIKQAQLGQQLMDSLSADVAKATSADPKLVKAMLGIGGAGGVGGSSAPSIDVKGFSAGLLTGIDAELVANKADYRKRGENLWASIGEGFVDGARKSGTFKAAVAALVEDALKGSGGGSAVSAAGRAQGVPS